MAAPWRYALATKIDRLGKSGARDKDLSDAVVYLHEVIRQKRRAVTMREIRDWFHEFSLGEPSQNVLVRLNEHYQATYRDRGIVQ